MDNPGDADSAAVAAGMDAVAAEAADAAPGFDVAGLAGLSDVPGQTVEGALGQMLFDLGLQQDTTTPQGMQTAIGTLQSLNNLGFGNLTGFNPNNPDQTVAQLVAAQNAHNALNATLPTIMSMLGPPGTGLAFNALNLAKGLESGQITPGQGLLSLGLGALGVPGPAASALQGNIGQAASGLAQSGLASAVGKALDVPAPVAGLGLNLSGIGPSIGQAVAGSVPNAPSTGTPGGLAGFIDQALGGFSLGSIAPGTPPTAGSMPGPETGYSADVFPVLAAIEEATQPQQQTQQPTMQSRMVAGRYGPLVDYQFGA